MFRKAGVLLLVVAACAVSGEPAAPPSDQGPPIPAAPFATVPADIDELEGLAYEKVADVDFPVQVVTRPGDAISYVVTNGGQILALQDGVVAEEPVLDISEDVSNAHEQGMFSMLLPEDVEVAYLSFTANNGDSVVAEFRFASPTELDPDSWRELFRLGQPATNHNGGMLQMLDGLIYLSLGDGGGAGDQFRNAQNTETLHGGIITISPAAEHPPRSFAHGLRNPWRFWFDEGLMYVTDVGQDTYEELNVTLIEEGHNFGWPITEGRHCYRPAEDCDATGTVFPDLELVHGDGGSCSITGGVVYRGTAIPELDGFYLYSDFCGGFLRGLRYLGDGEIETADWTSQVGKAGQVTGFGLDGEGEVFVATTEALFKIVPVR